MIARFYFSRYIEKMICTHSADSEQPGSLHSLLSVFLSHEKTHKQIFLLSEHESLGRDCAGFQADFGIHKAYLTFCGFLVLCLFYPVLILVYSIVIGK